VTEKDTLEAIRSRKAALKEELRALDLLEAEILNERSGVKKGDRVRRTYGTMKGCEFVVHEVHHIASRSSRGKPWVSGYMIRKDGTPGTQLKNLYYEWEKIDGVSSER
jgi:hypothetical protein